MGCNNCNSDEEGMWGWCSACQKERRERVRASIQEKQEESSDDSGQQTLTQF